MKYPHTAKAPGSAAWHAASNDPPGSTRILCVGCRDMCSRRMGGADNERSKQGQVEHTGVYGMPLEAWLPAYGRGAGPRRSFDGACWMWRQLRYVGLHGGRWNCGGEHPRDLAALLARTLTPFSTRAPTSPRSSTAYATRSLTTTWTSPRSSRCSRPTGRSAMTALPTPSTCAATPSSRRVSIRTVAPSPRRTSSTPSSAPPSSAR